MKFIRMAAVLACAAFLAGCLPVTSKTPVGSTAGLGADKALYGTWKGHDPKQPDQRDAFLHFMTSKSGEMTVAVVAAGGTTDDFWSIYSAKTATLGKNRFINAVATQDSSEPPGENLKNANIPLLYKMKGQSLTLYWLDEEKTKAAIKAGKLKGSVGPGENGDVQLTSDAAELDAFMATPEAAGLFKVMLVLKRVD